MAMPIQKQGKSQPPEPRAKSIAITSQAKPAAQWPLYHRPTGPRRNPKQPAARSDFSAAAKSLPQCLHLIAPKRTGSLQNGQGTVPVCSGCSSICTPPFGCLAPIRRTRYHGQHLRAYHTGYSLSKLACFHRVHRISGVANAARTGHERTKPRAELHRPAAPVRSSPLQTAQSASRTYVAHPSRNGRQEPARGTSRFAPPPPWPPAAPTHASDGGAPAQSPGRCPPALPHRRRPVPTALPDRQDRCRPSRWAGVESCQPDCSPPQPRRLRKVRLARVRMAMPNTSRITLSSHSSGQPAFFRKIPRTMVM